MSSRNTHRAKAPGLRLRFFDKMTVVDLPRIAMPIAANRSQALEHALTAQKAFHPISVHAHVQPMTDESAWHAVLFAFYREDAVLAHSCGQLVELRGTARRSLRRRWSVTTSVLSSGTTGRWRLRYPKHARSGAGSFARIERMRIDTSLVVALVAGRRVRGRRYPDKCLWEHEPHAEFFHFTQHVHNDREIRESTLREALAELRVQIINARVGVGLRLGRSRALAYIGVALSTLIALVDGHH
jgi:hypothetical protein